MLGWQDRHPLTTAISPDRAEALAAKPGFHTLGDVLLTYPTRYAAAGSAESLEPLVEGEMYTCVAKILTVEQQQNLSGRGPRSYIRFTFTDGTLRMESALFGNPRVHLQTIQPGATLMLHGKLDTYRNKWQIKSPSYVTIEPATGAKFGAYGPLKTIVTIAGSQQEAQRLLQMPYLPGYPRKAGTSTAEMIGVVDQILRGPLADQSRPAEMLPTPGGPSPAPEWPTDSEGKPLIAFGEAIRQIHQPDDAGPADAINRLKFNEALELQLVMALRRADATQRQATAVDAVQSELVASLIKNLPFRLSEGQKNAWNAVVANINSAEPASLMLQGDVGSGKTLVALLTMLATVDAGQQCAFIAPTEVLAAQHARNLIQLLDGLPVTVTLLTGGQKTDVKRQALLDIVSGQAQIIVGTHALIQDSVEFFNLGLVVVDEQHRFGVRQRDRLRDQAPQNATPHMLVMTATPIPRTVAMTMFGDLKTIRLDGLPGGRGKVSSAVVHAERSAWVERMWERIREDVAAGHQAYVVVPRIDGDDGVLAWSERLSTKELAGCTVEALHGRMNSEDKDHIMREFAEGNIDVLVATTVIEVGVDVANATVMVIIDSDRFGVSQLHQLRGRVGRGSTDSWCMFHTATDPESDSYQRLVAVAATTDGFALAELDLQQRTEGDILGNEQSGERARRATLLNLVTDGPIIEKARSYATELVALDMQRARDLTSGIEIEDQEYIERS